TDFNFGGMYGNVSRESKLNNIGFSGDAYEKALKEVGQDFKPPVWSQFGQPGRIKPEGLHKLGFKPEEPRNTPGAVRIWQYFASTTPGDFDMNLATQEAFDRMWKLPRLPAPGTDGSEDDEHIPLQIAWDPLPPKR